MSWLTDKLYDLLGEAAKNIGVTIITGAALFILRFLGVDLYRRLISRFRWCLLGFWRIFGWKTILVYTDCRDPIVTSKLTTHLNQSLRTYKFHARTISNPEKVRFWPLKPWGIHALVLIITDVSQLSSDTKIREDIQKRIEKYCHAGGTVILGHDALYRRAKNELLRKLAGGEINYFAANNNPIEYLKNSSSDRKCSDPKLLKSLPHSFKLDDREILQANWEPDVEFLYVQNNAVNNKGEPIPLVTRRIVANDKQRGLIYWMNTGDHHKNTAPPSLSDPIFYSVCETLLRPRIAKETKAPAQQPTSTTKTETQPVA